MNKRDIILLPTKQLHPHPENPRKDVGDVSELSESIKVNGILQNLTVVAGHFEGTDFLPGEYTVIIGHRRLAAAKKAKLKELPCIIAQMSPDEQVATMLTENMQRENLTVYEQAKAFQQLSIDFGKSVTEIAEMSGFSETTVRKRTKLADLNEVAFKRACERGATLFDFAELDKLETAEDKAKVLADMGTANFKNTLAETIRAQKYRHRRAEWIAALRTFATEIDKGGVGMNYYRNYGSWTPKSEEITKPEDADRVRYFFTVSDTQISVYKEATSDPVAEAKMAEQRRREDEAKNRWSEIEWKESQKLDRIYQFLESLGYEMSDEEKQLQNGTHPLFTKEEGASNDGE